MLLPSATSPANPVHVFLDVSGEIIVDHVTAMQANKG